MPSYLPFLLHSLFLTFLVLWLKRKYRNEPLIFLFLPAFYWKILAGIAYGWLYVIYYGGVGDSLNYFNDASSLANFAFEHPKSYLELIFLDKFFVFSEFSMDLWSQPRAFLMVKIVSVFTIFTFNHYWITGFYLSFLSFWGMWKLANSLTKKYPSTIYAAALAFLFFPSITFWSAGYTKESFVMAALGFSLSRVIDLSLAKKTRLWFLGSLLIWGISALLIGLIKYYYLAVLLPCLAAYFFTLWILNYLQSAKFGQYFRSSLAQIGLWLCIFSSLLLVATNLHYSLSPDYFMKAIVYNHNSTYIFSHPDDLIHYSIVPGFGYTTIIPRLYSLVYNSPLALFSGLYRPFIWETGGNKLKILLGLENLFVLLMSFYALYQFLKILKNKEGFIHKNSLLLTAILFYILILVTILAFASPNFGALARYRVGAYPFFVYLLTAHLSSLIKKA